MIATVRSGALLGIEAYLVEVEVDVASRGLPKFSVVGLPEEAIRESRDRVRTAIANTGYRFPPHRITVNLAPANRKKEGTAFDLPIALGILSATTGMGKETLKRLLFVGELALQGDLRPVRGVLSLALMAKASGLQGIVVPVENAQEAAIVQEIDVFPVQSLGVAMNFLAGRLALSSHRVDLDTLLSKQEAHTLDFADVRGQPLAKRAIEVVAAGGHNLLMIGPPGSGKTMLARRIPTVMPPLELEQCLETTRIYSTAGLLEPDTPLIAQRPFRSPHHHASDAGMVGGGSCPRPGEISLAHHGVLFLDELPEFGRRVLELLRQPLEEGSLCIARSGVSVRFPARVLLVAAMNPCPCGYLGDATHPCTCNESQIQKYQNRLSGPLLDRIDLHVEVPRVPWKDLGLQVSAPPSSRGIRERVVRAWRLQKERLKSSSVSSNSLMGSREIASYCGLKADGVRLMELAVERLGLSPRVYHRILKVSRTIADLEGSEQIETAHLAEALQYRILDRSIRFSMSTEATGRAKAMGAKRKGSVGP